MSTALSRIKRRPTVPSSIADMAMLRLAPISAAPLPRLHVEPRQADGRLQVFDRATGADVVVYTPSFMSQFRTGHRAGRWYVRPTTEVGSVPQSVGFATAREAVEAVRQGAWRLRVVAPEPSLIAGRTTKAAPFRVIWGDSAS